MAVGAAQSFNAVEVSGSLGEQRRILDTDGAATVDIWVAVGVIDPDLVGAAGAVEG